MSIPVIDPFGVADDPTMPFLARALDPHEAQRQFEGRLPRLSRGKGGVQIRAIRVTRYKPGRRCLIEYDVEVGQPNAPLQTVVGKARAKGLDTSSYEVAKAGTTLHVRLLDPNYQQVAEQTVKLGAFGSASGEFAVPAGRHRIEMAYRPRSVLLGLAVSALTLAAAVLLLRRPRGAAA